MHIVSVRWGRDFKNSKLIEAQTNLPDAYKRKSDGNAKYWNFTIH